jgi:DNA-directed RNA polymerase specialized sigma24 family protein
MSEKTQITIETRRMLVVHGPIEWARMWCPGCAALVYTLSPESAATLTQISSPRLYQLIDCGRIHSMGARTGPQFICLNSLNAYQENHHDTYQEPESSEGDHSGSEAPGESFADGDNVLAVQGPQLGRATQWTPSPEPWIPAAVEREDQSPGLGSRLHNLNIGIGLTQDLFDGLLARLDSDREQAGYKYEEMRRKLIKLFECRGCSNPAELADETINRGAKKLNEGQELWVDDPAIYFYGVARNVLKESFRNSGRQVPIECLEGFQEAWPEHKSHEEELEACLAHLDVLLREMPAESRELITSYYQGEKSAKIQGRRVLAQNLGIPVSALRIRAYRIKEKLRRTLKREMAEWSS